jgi:hypothetical protein
MNHDTKQHTEWTLWLEFKDGSSGERSMGTSPMTQSEAEALGRELAHGQGLGFLLIRPKPAPLPKLTQPEPEHARKCQQDGDMKDFWAAMPLFEIILAIIFIGVVLAWMLR